MEIQQFKLARNIVDIALQRKALILVCLLLSLSIGLGLYLKQPKVYQSSCLLSYQQQKINPARMSPDMEERLSDIVSTLSQIVTSRSSLEKIILDNNLYTKQRELLPMEDVVGMMRKNISIPPSRRGDTFQVSFKGHNPANVASTTNAIASRFIEENLKYREERASETSSYTQDELDMAKEMLDKKEATMRDYKLKFYNEMPDQSVTNMSRLISLQDQYQNRQESIQDLERTRVLIRDQIAVRRQLLENTSLNQVTIAPTDSEQNPAESDQDRLARLQNLLNEMLGRYKPQHPKIKSLQRKIDALTQKIASQTDSEDIEGNSTKQDDLPQSTSENTVSNSLRNSATNNEQFNEAIFDLEVELKNISLNIKEINREKADIQKQIKLYEQWVANTPVREAEWSSLTREYSELKNHYDFLVTQNLQAKSALNLERRQKGSQFKIEDRARTPIKPIQPDFLRMMAIALGAGCAAGGGLAFALATLDNSFKHPEEIEETLEVDVIATVPLLPLKREIFFQRFWATTGTIFFICWAAAFVFAFFYFYKQGQIIF